MKVTGFSVGGRVVDENDMGVEGVKILVDGHERSITDKEGFYKLDQVLWIMFDDLFAYVLIRQTPCINYS